MRLDRSAKLVFKLIINVVGAKLERGFGFYQAEKCVRLQQAFV